MDETALGVGLATLVTQAFMFATMIWRDWANERKAKVLRAWEIEDRAALARHVATTTGEIKEAIAENTTITVETKEAAHQAYEKANTIGQKLETIGITQLAIQQAGIDDNHDPKS